MLLPRARERKGIGWNVASDSGSGAYGGPLSDADRRD
jgi:hypothetical protein